MDGSAQEEKQGAQEAKPGKPNNNLISANSSEQESEENGKITNKNNKWTDNSLPELHNHNDDMSSKSNTSPSS